MATNKTPLYTGRSGSPKFIYLPVQAGATQEIKKGEICKYRSLTDFATYPIVPASADDSDFIPVIAWEEQDVSMPARIMQFVLPREGDSFEYALNTATTLNPGSQLELATSQSFKSGSSHVVSVAVKGSNDGLYNANASRKSVSSVFVEFCRVTASGLNQFPELGFPAQLNVTSGISKVISDPGTAEAIPVDSSGNIALTIAASATETNTLAAPAAAGLELVISAKSVGESGSRVVTVAHNIDGTNNTITFDAAGEDIRLYSVQTGASAYEWRKAAVTAACSHV